MLSLNNSIARSFLRLITTPDGKASNMRTLTPGAWYFLFLCKACKTKQILFCDLNQGKSKFLATFIVESQDCGHKASYDSEDIERYQHPAYVRRALA